MASLLLSVPIGSRWAESFLALSACAQIIRRIKLGGFDVDGSLSLGDLACVGAATACLAAASPGGAWWPEAPSGPWWLSAALATLIAVSLWGLWLDALLFRVFTIELGPGGVRDIVPAVLYQELAELSYARRFLREHRSFPLLPVAACLTCLDAGANLSGALHLIALGGAVGLLAITALTSDWAGRLRALGLVAALALTLAFEREAWFFLVPPLTLVIAGAPWPRADAPAGIAHFFVARRPPAPRRFRPRPEHAALLEASPSLPEPSRHHGSLRGAPIVLFTFESVGRDHLEVHRTGGAEAPLYRSLLERGLVSSAHACVCPTTNAAHVSLYHADYAEGAFSAVAALRAAGYRTAYLTSARTREYGLRGILERAGFEQIFDQMATDLDLVARGPELLAPAPGDDRPLFLHVHATHTHVPYRVGDPTRFARFDHDDDCGRFKNGIEESDAIFAALLEALGSHGIVDKPLVALTSDHGQAFGAFGYQSHGSAIVADELLVPFVVAHPDLSPTRVESSSHFDVLPTLLDLVGVDAPAPCWGVSLVGDRPPAARDPGLLVWAGHPSRTTTTNYGLVVGDRKLMADLVLGRCYEMGANDEGARPLRGDERAYVGALLGHLMRARRVR